MNKYYFYILLVTLLSGCAAVPVGKKSDALNNVSVGMAKSEVISTVGVPSRVSAKEGVEYLIYRLIDDIDYTVSSLTLGVAPPEITKSDYFIKITGGKVTSFGKIGDFGTSIESK